LGLTLLAVVLAAFGSPLVVRLVLDDTLTYRTGKKVALATSHADPVLKQSDGRPFVSYRLPVLPAVGLHDLEVLSRHAVLVSLSSLAHEHVDYYSTPRVPLQLKSSESDLVPTEPKTARPTHRNH